MSDGYGDYDLPQQQHGSVSMTVTTTPVSVVAAFSDDSLERYEHALLGQDAFEPLPISGGNVKRNHATELEKEASEMRQLNGSSNNGMTHKRRSSSISSQPQQQQPPKPPPPRCESPFTSRRTKKPKGMPKRPLNAFSLYFQKERAIAMESGKYKGKINLDDIGKEAAQKWQDLTDRERKHYEELAYLDACRYRREMEHYSEGSNDKKRDRESKQHFEEVCAYFEEKKTNGSSEGSQRNFEPNYELPPPPPASTGYIHPSWYNRSRTPPPPTIGHEANFPGALPPPMQPMDFHPYATALGMNRGRPFGSHPLMPPQAHNMPKPPPQANLPQHQQQPNLDEVRNSFPMPPGMEIVLPDPDGNSRRYRVKYACFSMTRDAAMKYMQDLTGDSSPNFPEASAGDLGLPVRSVGESSPRLTAA